jgi:ferrochelatase
VSRFTAVTEDPHQRFHSRTAILLTNLGSPDAPTTPAVRTYLAEFLSDTRIIEIPRLIWKVILHGIILRIRPKRSAKLYKSIWTDEGSPLLANSKKQQAKLNKLLIDKGAEGDNVFLAMRYGNPSMKSVLEDIREKGYRRIVVLPLYPQYSASTIGSTFDAIAKQLVNWRWVPELHFINGYQDNSHYIDALASSIKEDLDKHGMPDKLVLSYHGTPKFFLDKGDPYHCFCQMTSRLVIEKLGLDKEQVITTFQSRFGKAEWLKPYTDETLENLAKDGIKNIAIASPAFSSDCLETLEELEGENREIFMEAGGENYRYIPALNDRDDHIHALYQILKPYL